MKKYILSASLGVSIGTIISIITSSIFGQGTYLPLNPLSTMGAYYVEHFNQPTVMLICVLTWASIGIFRPHTTGYFSWLVSTQSWLFAFLLANLCLGLRFAIFSKLSKNGAVYQGH